MSRRARKPAAPRRGAPAPLPPPAPTPPSWAPRVAVLALIVTYVALNVLLVLRKVETCEELAVFSHDESSICENAIAILNHRSFVFPGCEPYPYGQLYAVAIGGPFLALGGLVPMSEAAVIRWAAFLLVLSGAAVLGLTYAVTSRLYSPWAGALATVLLLATVELWRWSTTIHPDVPQLAFLMAGFYFCVRLYERRRAEDGPGGGREVVAAALSAGLAMATKFNGIFLLPPFLVAANAGWIAGRSRRPLGRRLADNAKDTGLFVLCFAAAFAIFNPCLFAEKAVATGPLTRAMDIVQMHVSRYSLQDRLQNLLFSNFNMANLVVGGVYPLTLLGLCLTVFSLVRRRREELARPRILCEAFLLPFLAYSLLLGYGLKLGKLLQGYERYLLPAVPLLLIVAMRVVEVVVGRAGRWRTAVAAAAGAVMLMLQWPLVTRAYADYTAAFHLREAGNYMVRQWVLDNLPRGSIIYTEKYINVPTTDYCVVRHYAVGNYEIMRLADYVIARTLRYSLYSNPQLWERKNTPGMRVARRVHLMLEKGQVPGFAQEAVLGAGGWFGDEDTVVVYRNTEGGRGKCVLEE